MSVALVRSMTSTAVPLLGRQQATGARQYKCAASWPHSRIIVYAAALQRLGGSIPNCPCSSSQACLHVRGAAHNERKN